MEDWPLQNQVEPFHSHASSLKPLGWQQWKQKTSLYLHYIRLVATDWLSQHTGNMLCATLHTPHGGSGVRHCGCYALLRLWKAQMWVVLAHCRLRPQQSQALKHYMCPLFTLDLRLVSGDRGTPFNLWLLYWENEFPKDWFFSSLKTPICLFWACLTAWWPFLTMIAGTKERALSACVLYLWDLSRAWF